MEPLRQPGARVRPGIPRRGHLGDLREAPALRRQRHLPDARLGDARGSAGALRAAAGTPPRAPAASSARSHRATTSLIAPNHAIAVTRVSIGGIAPAATASSRYPWMSVANRAWSAFVSVWKTRPAPIVSRNRRRAIVRWPAKSRARVDRGLGPGDRLGLERHRPLDPPDELVRGRLHELAEDRLLGREVEVDAALGGLRRPRDVVHGGVAVAAGGERGNAASRIRSRRLRLCSAGSGRGIVRASCGPWLANRPTGRSVRASYRARRRTGIGHSQRGGHRLAGPRVGRSPTIRGMSLEAQLEALLRLVLAGVSAGVLGIEREAADKPAGMRTFAVVGIGSCLFTLTAIQGFDGQPDAISRVTAQIVTGIGFLACTIIQAAEHGERAHDRGRDLGGGRGGRRVRVGALRAGRRHDPAAAGGHVAGARVVPSARPGADP